VSVSFSAPAGKTVSVTARLPARARTQLARSSVLHAKVAIAAHDPAGTIASTLASVTLRAAARRH
jgi:hypothetical protein